MALCLYYSTITKHSNLNLIDRLQFPWLTASIGKLLVKIAFLSLGNDIERIYLTMRHWINRKDDFYLPIL